MRARLQVTITPADVGRRVSVRSRVRADVGEPSTTDAVGWLEQWSDDQLRVRRRDGTVATIATDDLLAGKVLADRPPVRRVRPLRVAGRPNGTAAWRRQVAAEAAGVDLGRGVLLAFTLPPAQWIDLDTLAETTLRGLADAGALKPRFVNLDSVTATKRVGEDTGVVIAAGGRRDTPTPGPQALAVSAPAHPRPGDRPAKRAWRQVVAEAWAGAAPLTGSVWAEVRFGVTGSLLTPLEVALDGLEPVLGRDPRGRSWQEFFPNDDRIGWLRVGRGPAGSGLQLRLGPLHQD